MDKKIMAFSLAAISTGLILAANKVKKAFQWNYFTMDELTYSATAKAKGIDNTPTNEARANLLLLRDNVLNPVRERFGRPIRITSGYRCPALDAVVGGAGNSQHRKGQAADMQPYSTGTINELFRAAVEHGVYDQLILEHSGNSRWVHISYAPTLRRQILYYNGSYYTDISNSWEKYIL